MNPEQTLASDLDATMIHISEQGSPSDNVNTLPRHRLPSLQSTTTCDAAAPYSLPCVVTPSVTSPLSYPCAHQQHHASTPEFKINMPTSGNSIQHVQPINYFLKAPNLKSWNISYSGESNVDDFLLTVKELKSARQVDDGTVIRGFTELLTGNALKFFRSIRHKITDWKSLELEFKSFFQTIDANYILERDIRQLKQLPGQSLSLFLLDIRDMNSRLVHPLDDTTLLEIVKHNLHNSYTHLVALNNVTSLEQLSSMGKNYEAYAGTLTSPTSSNSNFYIKKEPEPKTNNIKQQLQCLKCKKFGHSYKVCKSVTEPVCFNCGLKDTLTKNCPKCTKQPRSSAPTQNPKSKPKN